MKAKTARRLLKNLLKQVGRKRRITRKQIARLTLLASLAAPASWGDNVELIDWDRHGNKTCAFLFFDNPGTKRDIDSIWCSDGTITRL